jgi:flagellar basal-body rod protein FlgB
MAITWRAALDLNPDAMFWQSKRSEILAGNIANADTPNYHARDYDFHQIMKSIAGIEEGLPLARTNPMHLPIAKEPNELYYRIPFSPAVDGNTVDPDLERQNFLENSLGYMSTLRFLEGDLKELMTAIRGT